MVKKRCQLGCDAVIDGMGRASLPAPVEVDWFIFFRRVGGHGARRASHGGGRKAWSASRGSHPCKAAKQRTSLALASSCLSQDSHNGRGKQRQADLFQIWGVGKHAWLFYQHGWLHRKRGGSGEGAASPPPRPHLCTAFA